MRRFAFVNVGSPDDDTFRRLLAGPGDVVARLLPLRELHDIGPAIFLDAAEYASIRLLDRVDESLVVFEAFNAYVLPQLEELDAPASARLLAILDDALDAPEQQAVREVLTEYGVVDRVA
jgi:hypothetical protein